MNMIEMAKIIRYCRQQIGLSQQGLADRAGVGKTAVFDIEKGKPTVQLDTLLKILAVLEIRVQFKTPFALVTWKHT